MPLIDIAGRGIIIFKKNYQLKCKQIKLLPLFYKFNMNDMIILFYTLYKIIPIDMPTYLSIFNGQTCLRTSHLDNLLFVSSLTLRTTSSHFLN